MLSTGRVVLTGLLLVLLGVGLAVVLLVNYGDEDKANANRLDAIRTAGTVMVGTGGAVALWLAARRQQSTERTLRQTEYDASARRITELYTKAAEHLGSDKAPVRLASLYALERLAQDHDDQRETIRVRSLCLSMHAVSLGRGRAGW